MVFGIRGAKWLPSVMRTIASAYWFAVQTIVGATVIVAIAHQWTGRNYSVVRTGMVLAALQVLIALIGYEWLKLISRFSLPVKVLALCICSGCWSIVPGQIIGSMQSCISIPVFMRIWAAAPAGSGVAQQPDRVVAHHDHRRGGFLPLHPQPR